MFHFEDMGR